MNIPELAFHHAGVSVPNLDAAIRWYKRVLGFELENRFYIEEANSQTALLKRGSLRFEIFEVEGAAPLPDSRREPVSDLRTHGNKHAAFQVNDLAHFIEHLESQRADIALIVNEDFGKSCFVRDCAGNLIEFVQIQTPS